jgi:hypothetical protein
MLKINNQDQSNNQKQINNKNKNKSKKKTKQNNPVDTIVFTSNAYTI